MSNPLFDLTGRTALVTGSSRGLGRAMAEGLANAGAKIIVNGTDAARVAKAVDEMRTAGMQAEGLVFDVTDEAAVKTLVDQTIARFGKVDIALLNAGIEGHVGLLTEYPADAFDKVIAVNVRGVWLGLKYAMRAMQAAA